MLAHDFVDNRIEPTSCSISNRPLSSSMSAMTFHASHSFFPIAHSTLPMNSFLNHQAPFIDAQLSDHLQNINRAKVNGKAPKCLLDV